MKYYLSTMALFAAVGIGFVGCDTTESEPEREVEVERVDPEADVEVLPSGEVDVEVEPDVTE